MILVIDNYDSFTYNLVQYLGQCGATVEVRRNDKITADEAGMMKPSGILLSPGPCTPKESGVCLDILAAARDEDHPIYGIPVFGVCLGLQAIGHQSGAEVGSAKKMMHGKVSTITHDGQGVFRDIPSPVDVTRYHSLAIHEGTLPDDLLVTAWTTDDQEIMAVRHRSLPIEGVQFHPEAVMTEHGIQMIRNFVQQCA